MRFAALAVRLVDRLVDLRGGLRVDLLVDLLGSVVARRVPLAVALRALVAAAVATGTAAVFTDGGLVHGRAAPTVVGHRGAPAHRPENTLAGFSLAAAHNAAVELDLRVTRDDALVVIHDAVVPARCTVEEGAAPPPTRRVRALSLAELRRFDCGAADPAFPRQRPAGGARIPTLDEVLALHAPLFLVEVKADDAPPPMRLAHLLARAVPRGGRVAARVVVESFSDPVVAAVAAHAPWLARGLLVEDGEDAVGRAERVAALLVSPPAARTDAALVAAAHKAGLAVVPWTVNDDAGWRRLAGLGVDAIVTDDPLRPR